MLALQVTSPRSHSTSLSLSFCGKVGTGDIYVTGAARSEPKHIKGRRQELTFSFDLSENERGTSLCKLTLGTKGPFL